MCVEETFQAGETLSAGGSRRHCAYVILQGTVASLLVLEDRQVPLTQHSAGDAVAFSSLLGGGPVGTISYRAMQNTRTLCIAADRFQELSKSFPVMALEVYRAIALRLIHNNQQLRLALLQPQNR
ncbi:MAG: Crp/Fnr family transcriptional regulator [Chloroflexi bacterium]|nr:Crp/Fnr family transcriptional regulator [Chloroflexota bacterium]